MAKDTQTDKAILEGGLDSPKVSGDFHLFEVSIHSPSNLDAPLELNHESVFVELDIFEDLFSNVLKGTFTFMDTQGWAEQVPLIGDETLVISYSSPGGGGTIIDAQYAGSETKPPNSEEITRQRFKVYDCVEIGTEEKTKIIQLSLVSEEYMFSKKMKVSKGYKGTKFGAPVGGKDKSIVGDIMKKLNKESEHLNKELYIEETLSGQNVIIPNWTPFQAINFCASRSLSADSKPVEQDEGSTNPSPVARPAGSLLSLIHI